MILSRNFDFQFSKVPLDRRTTDPVARIPATVAGGIVLLPNDGQLGVHVSPYRHRRTFTQEILHPRSAQRRSPVHQPRGGRNIVPKGRSAKPARWFPRSERAGTTARIAQLLAASQTTVGKRATGADSLSLNRPSLRRPFSILMAPLMSSRHSLSTENTGGSRFSSQIPMRRYRRTRGISVRCFV